MPYQVWAVTYKNLRLTGREQKMPIRKELLDILVCPKCKGEIYLNDDENGLICDHCKLLYEIQSGIPNMLIEDAKPSKK